MPAISPAEISDGVSLSDKLRTARRPFVAEDGTVDAFLRFPGALVDAVVKKLPPNKQRRQRLAWVVPHDVRFAWANELSYPSAVPVPLRWIVTLVHPQAFDVAVLRAPPVRSQSLHHRERLPVALPLHIRLFGSAWFVSPSRCQSLKPRR